MMNNPTIFHPVTKTTQTHTTCRGNTHLRSRRCPQHIRLSKGKDSGIACAVTVQHHLVRPLTPVPPHFHISTSTAQTKCIILTKSQLTTAALPLTGLLYQPPPIRDARAPPGVRKKVRNLRKVSPVHPKLSLLPPGNNYTHDL